MVKTYRETYVKTSLQEFKRELEGAVALIKDEKVIAELLESFKNADIVKPQDIAFSWFYLSINATRAVICLIAISIERFKP